MHRCFKKPIPLFFVLLVFICVHTKSDAYVPQGPHILELMIEKLGKARRLLVFQKLQFYNSSEKQTPVEINETLRYVFPEKFRSDIESENAQRIYVLSKGRALTIIDGKVEVDAETRFDLYKDILLFRSRKLLVKRLSRFGIDVTVSSLGRFQDRIVYVLGANYPDESVPQIWIDKETFRPLRWIITRKVENHADSLEVRYLEWEKRESTYYPMRVEFYQDNKLVRGIKNIEVRVNPSFQDALFDIEHLKAINMPATPVMPVQLESEEISEVQKMINEFKKIYE